MAIPTRTCVACRRSAGKPELIRLAVGARAVQVDRRARLAGRGAYLCGRGPCLDAALRRDGAVIRRALRLRGGDVELDAGALRRQLDASENSTDEHPARHDDRRRAGGSVKGVCA